MSRFDWSKTANEAAELVAAGDLGYETIAANLGINRTTLWYWRKDPEFAARVAELQEAHKQEIFGKGIALKHKRVKALNDRWNRMQRVIEARADDPIMQGVAGGQTGLLVATPKSVYVSGGEQGERSVEYEYSVDTALLKEIRETEKQAAIEIGQWQDKVELQTPQIKTDDLKQPPVAPELIASALAIAAKHTAMAKVEAEARQNADDSGNAS